MSDFLPKHVYNSSACIVKFCFQTIGILAEVEREITLASTDKKLEQMSKSRLHGNGLN